MCSINRAQLPSQILNNVAVSFNIIHVFFTSISFVVYGAVLFKTEISTTKLVYLFHKIKSKLLL